MKGTELLIENVGLECFVGKLLQRLETKHYHVFELRGGNTHPLMLQVQHGPTQTRERLVINENCRPTSFMNIEFIVFGR